MRTLLLAAVGAVWGAAMVVAGIANGVFESSGAYGAGQMAAFAFGVGLLLVSGWTLLKRFRSD